MPSRDHDGRNDVREPARWRGDDLAELRGDGPLKGESRQGPRDVGQADLQRRTFETNAIAALARKHEEGWHKKSPEDIRDLFQSVERALARSHGRPEAEIRVGPPQPADFATRAEYDQMMENHQPGWITAKHGRFIYFNERFFAEGAAGCLAELGQMSREQLQQAVVADFERARGTGTQCDLRGVPERTARAWADGEPALDPTSPHPQMVNSRQADAEQYFIDIVRAFNGTSRSHGARD